MLNERILKYCNLDKSIFMANVNIHDLKTSFYTMSFTTRTEFTDQGIRVRGANVESEVLDYVTVLDELEDSQRARLRRYKAFSALFIDLPIDKQNYIYSRYVELVQVEENPTIERYVLTNIRKIERGIRQRETKELKEWVNETLTTTVNDFTLVNNS